MSKVLISADSVADLSPALAAQVGVPSFPLYITLDDHSGRDGVEVLTRDVFDFVAKTGKLPKTSAPNFQDYVDFFTSFIDDGYEIVHFSISASMSSSHSVCALAAAEMAERGGKVYPIDSLHLSTGIALLVLRAAEWRDEGLGGAEIAERILAMREKVQTSFVLDTLQYLYKGGRCSSLAALGANLLKLKPCIEVHDGAMDVAKKYRGKMPEVLKSYVADKLANPDSIDTSRAFLTHTFDSDDHPVLLEVKAQVQALVPFDEVIINTAGSAISVHCGPNTMGLLYLWK